MKRRRLGETDLEVSVLALGTMQFGWTADERQALDVLDAFVEAGGNLVDTADIYSRWVPGNPGGVAEAILGRWLRARGQRHRVIIATKGRGQMWDGPDGEGLGRAHLTRAVEDSLRRLGVETIDLYQCHWPDEAVPIEETLGTLGGLVASGKIRWLGASNYGPQALQAALETARGRSLPRFATLQPHYNLVHRDEFEGELARLCARERLGVLPYSPLGSGFLTGKYRRDGDVPASARAERIRSRYMNDRGFAALAECEAVAGRHGVTPAAVALAWLLERPGVAAPIVGANTRSQLGDLLPAARLQLAADEVAALDRASGAA